MLHQNTNIRAGISLYRNRIIRETIDIQHDPSSMKREESLSLWSVPQISREKFSRRKRNLTYKYLTLSQFKSNIGCSLCWDGRTSYNLSYAWMAIPDHYAQHLWRIKIPGRCLCHNLWHLLHFIQIHGVTFPSLRAKVEFVRKFGELLSFRHSVMLSRLNSE